MLKRIFIFLFTFMIVVLTASLIGGTLSYFTEKVRIINYSKERIRLYHNLSWFDAVKTAMFFTFLATLIYYAVKKVILPNYNLNLFKSCVVGFFATLFGLLFPILIAGYRIGGFDLSAWINILVTCAVEGSAIAFTATLLNNLFVSFFITKRNQQDKPITP